MQGLGRTYTVPSVDTQEFQDLMPGSRGPAVWLAKSNSGSDWLIYSGSLTYFDSPRLGQLSEFESMSAKAER